MLASAVSSKMLEAMAQVTAHPLTGPSSLGLTPTLCTAPVTVFAIAHGAMAHMAFFNASYPRSKPAF